MLRPEQVLYRIYPEVCLSELPSDCVVDNCRILLTGRPYTFLSIHIVTVYRTHVH
jgi:hypothetical protein